VCVRVCVCVRPAPALWPRASCITRQVQFLSEVIDENDGRKPHIAVELPALSHWTASFLTAASEAASETLLRCFVLPWKAVRVISDCGCIAAGSVTCGPFPET